MKEWTDDKLVHFHVIYETSRRFTSHDTDMKVLQVEFCLFPRKTTNSVASGGHIKIPGDLLTPVGPRAPRLGVRLLRRPVSGGARQNPAGGGKPAPSHPSTAQAPPSPPCRVLEGGGGPQKKLG